MNETGPERIPDGEAAELQRLATEAVVKAAGQLGVRPVFLARFLWRDQQLARMMELSRTLRLDPNGRVSEHLVDLQENPRAFLGFLEEAMAERRERRREPPDQAA